MILNHHDDFVLYLNEYLYLNNELYLLIFYLLHMEYEYMYMDYDIVLINQNRLYKSIDVNKHLNLT